MANETLATRRQFLAASAGCAAHLMLLASANPLRAIELFSRTRGRIAAQEPWGRIERVSDGIWALVSTPLQDRTTLCNGGIIQGNAGVLVIESFAQPQGATWLAQQARQLTGRWPDHVILTHYHGDHAGGIAGYQHEDQTSRIHCTHVTRELVRQQDASRNVDPASPRAALLANATIIDGNAESTIDLGNRTVRIIPREGHTRSDVTVEVVDPSVVFCGDLVWNRMFPNYVDAVPSRLTRAVNNLTRTSSTRYVPGHGPLAEAADIRTYVTVLNAVEQAARAAKTAGQTAAEAAASFRLPLDAGQWHLFSPRYFETAIGAWLRELG